jgi:hypothetical protein
VSRLPAHGVESKPHCCVHTPHTHAHNARTHALAFTPTHTHGHPLPVRNTLALPRKRLHTCSVRLHSRRRCSCHFSCIIFFASRREALLSLARTTPNLPVSLDLLSLAPSTLYIKYTHTHTYTHHTTHHGYAKCQVRGCWRFVWLKCCRLNCYQGVVFTMARCIFVCLCAYMCARVCVSVCLCMWSASVWVCVCVCVCSCASVSTGFRCEIVC